MDDNRINAYTKPIDVEESDNVDEGPTDSQESQESSDDDGKTKKPAKEVIGGGYGPDGGRSVNRFLCRLGLRQCRRL